jgi:CubicO group peptidase (beta-lactamase class C family)
LSGRVGWACATIEGMSLADGLRQLFDGLAAADAYPGVVLVEQGTDTVFEGAYGWASRAWRVPNTLDTRFDTASITKAFTATAVLQLIDDGRLSFDTSVIDLLGLEGTAISRDVTVLHCLTHTSGIADDADEEAGEAYADVFRDRPNYSVIETADFLPQFAYKPAVFPPGQGCRYNNVAFVLLGLCIEHVTGTTYRDHVREHVFARAGMARTDFFRMDVVAHGVAEGVDPFLGDDGTIAGWRRNIYSYPPIGSPDGGAHTTAHDLARFWRAARTGRLFSAESTERFLQPHAFHSRDEQRVLRYGFGIDHVADAHDRPMFIEKEGYNAGVSADVRWYPGRDVTVVMLSNTSDGVWAPMREVHQLVMGM